MSEGDDRRSGPDGEGGSEDMMASIRRRLAAEHADEARRDGVLPLTPAMRSGGSEPGPGAVPEGEDAPLLLTPAMRVDPPTAGGATEGTARDIREAMGDGAPRAAADPSAPSAGLPDGDALRALVRDTIREELSGDLGARVSRNIKLLVEREVRRALEVLESEAEAEEAARVARERGEDA